MKAKNAIVCKPPIKFWQPHQFTYWKKNRQIYGTPGKYYLKKRHISLAFNMVPGDQWTRVFNNLVKNIVKKTNSHVGCGLIGIKYLFRLLSENGRPDLAYTIATQRDYPWVIAMQIKAVVAYHFIHKTL